MTQPTLFDLLDQEMCLYRSAPTGLAAKAAAASAWVARYGNWNCFAASHGWFVHYCKTDPSERCLPALMSARLPSDPGSACGCQADGLLYLGVCRGCDWEGTQRPDSNGAVEDAHDHCWPGWRDLPPVPRIPMDAEGTAKAAVKAMGRWQEQVNAIYPAGWLESGAPIRTLRTPGGTRHVPDRTPYGGYDLAHPDQV